LQRFLGLGLQIAPDALDLIINTGEPTAVVDRIIAARIDPTAVPVISRQYVETLLGGKDNTTSSTGLQETVVVVERRPDEIVSHEAGNYEKPRTWALDVIQSPTLDAVGSEGTVQDFHALFMDRFNRIRRMFVTRVDTQGAIRIEDAVARKKFARRASLMGRRDRRAEKPPATKIIGMVRNKSVSRSRNIIVELEDPSGTITCVIPSGRSDIDGQSLVRRGNGLLLDEVVCISGIIDRDGRLIADDVIYPDIPVAREPGRAEREVYAAFISDIHCGSNEFLEDEFERFVRWMAGHDVEPEDNKMVPKIEYLFIAGDLCDGVGVYPDQEKDLLIDSVHEQYSLLAHYLAKLPARVKIITIPGNHDACRQALPKPPIPEDFADALYKLGNRILMLGDPSYVLVEGVTVLLTHGDSLDDLVTQLPGASYKSPAIPMIELLRKRHLAPLYGGKTELAPLSRDWLVIDRIPDIVHFGHAHHNAVDNYRGVQIINSGTFQAQTDFMRKQGVVPTPGIVTIVNLKTGAPVVRMFYDFSEINGPR